MDDETARMVVSKDAFVVPTLAIIYALAEQAQELGLPPQSQDKVSLIINRALEGLQSMRRAGVKVGFGTDLLGATYVQQCREFVLRREVFSHLEILRQVTSTNAAILPHEGKLGCIKANAFADVLVVDGDPLRDIELLAANGRNLRVIMRAGELVKNELA